MPSSGQLVGRTAIVTGASRGIGRAIAVALGRAGASVALAARTTEPEAGVPGTVHDAADEVRAAGGQAIAVACDVTSDVDLVELVARAGHELGPADIVVNNAAATVPGRPGRRPAPSGAPPPGRVGVLDMPLKAVRTQLEVNLVAPWRLMQLTVPGMVERGRGAVINIGSEAARLPGPAAGYGASKLALEHLTRSVAADLVGTAVAVTTLVPSRPVATPGLAWAVGDLPDADGPDLFATAAIRVLEAGAAWSGRVLHSDDVLHPEQRSRGWVGATEGGGRR